MIEKNYRILVLDADQRSALAIVRSLGKDSSLKIYTASPDTEALAGESRFCHHYSAYPSPKTRPDAFCLWLIEFTKKHHIDIVYPTTEITSQLILIHQDKLAGIRIPFGSHERVLAIADKGALVKRAEALSIPCPATQHYDKADALNIDAITQYPVVLKPRLSHIWMNGHWLSTQVHIAHNKANMTELLQRLYFKDHPFLLQEYVPGHGAGIFALYDQGKEVAFFAHRRLREKPPTGGVSVLCESATCDQRLLSYARALLEGANWHGVAMVEFRVDDKDNAYLMEVNTRFWGSLQLAIDAGVDFPYLLHQITCGDNVQRLEHYKVGQRLRWLLGDIDSLYLAMKSRTYSIKQKLVYLLKFLAPHPLSTKHEINRFSDMRPAVFELKKYFLDIFRK